jgi:CRP-like cAMP-binding protein
MDLHRTIELLQKTPLVAELNYEEVEILASVISSRALGDGEVLLREGETDNALHCLVAGKLSVEKEAAGGREPVTLHILQKGDLAGEMGFVDGKEHTATLRALGAAAVITVERERLESLLPEHPHLVYMVMRAVVRAGHAIVRRMNIQYVELTNYITHSHGRY